MQNSGRQRSRRDVYKQLIEDAGATSCLIYVKVPGCRDEGEETIILAAPKRSTSGTSNASVDLLIGRREL
jgi:hypothetical protein